MNEAWECISYADNFLNLSNKVLLVIKLLVSDGDVEAYTICNELRQGNLKLIFRNTENIGWLDNCLHVVSRKKKKINESTDLLATKLNN